MSETLSENLACAVNVQEIMQALTNITSTIVPGFTHLIKIEEEVAIDAIAPQLGIARLAQAIAQSTPEAGPAYWRLRVWGLLIWQPVYLALISTYTLHTHLSSLDRLSQQQNVNYTLGFHLPALASEASNAHTAESVPANDLIQAQALRLKSLCDRYAEALCEQMHLRPALLMAVLADTLFATLEHLAKQAIIPLSVPNISQWVYQEGAKWCQMMAINPPKSAEQLMATQTDFRRKTCCLVYRCQGASECSNCPRLAEKCRG